MNAIFIIELSFLGLPPVVFVGRILLALARGFLPMFRRSPVRSTLGGLLVALPALGVLPYLAVIAAELYVQITCSGAGCAQGGVGLMMFTPLPWLCGFVVLIVSKVAYNGRFLPHLASGGPV